LTISRTKLARDKAQHILSPRVHDALVPRTSHALQLIAVPRLQIQTRAYCLEAPKRRFQLIAMSRRRNTLSLLGLLVLLQWQHLIVSAQQYDRDCPPGTHLSNGICISSTRVRFTVSFSHFYLSKF
jgi:hypothetical protein